MIDGAILLASGLTFMLWRPCRSREGRAPRVALMLLLLSSAAVWAGSFSLAVALAAQEPAGTWTACGVVWRQLLAGELGWWRLVPLVAWVAAFPARGVAAVAVQQARSRGLARVLSAPAQASVDGVKVVPGLSTPAVTVGLLRPAVFVDAEFWEHATPLQRRVVVDHERAHARGRHAFVEAAGTLVTSPLRPLRAAGDVYDCVRRHLEALADDAAVRRHGEQAVGTALGHVALQSYPNAGLGATGACVWRVKRLLAPAPARRDGFVLLVMVVMMALMFVPTAASAASALGPVVGADYCPI